MSGVPAEALVLCAGEGRRLRPLSAHTPKPLAPFLNLPTLRHGLRRLARAGVRRVWLNAWHLADRIEAFAASDPEPGLELRALVEPELLGTGGALPHLLPHLRGETLLVQVADVIHDLDLQAFAAEHHGRGAAASMALTTRADPERFGPVEIDAEGRMCDIVRRRGVPGARALVNASTHLLQTEVLERLPTGPCCLVRQGYLEWLDAGLNCVGFVDESPWAETGTIQALLDAQAAALRGELPVDAKLLAEGGVLLPDAAGRAAEALVHAEARVADDARLLDGTTVAAGAEVGAGAELRHCLVLPGARIAPGTVARDAVLGASRGATELVP